MSLKWIVEQLQSELPAIEIYPMTLDFCISDHQIPFIGIKKVLRTSCFESREKLIFVTAIVC